MFHEVTRTPEESAALAIDAGCDLNCGNIYLYLLKAVEKELVTEEHITKAAVRLFTTRYKLGMFTETEYDKIPYTVVECEEHLQLAVDAARKSMVLLKNNGILPLDKNQLRRIAVIGPNANSRLVLKGNYYGTSSHYITLLEGIQEAAGDEVRVLYAKGCELAADRTEPLAFAADRIAEAVTAAEHSDVTVLCLGLDETLEGEELDEGNNCGSGDKQDLQLPEVQRKLMEAVAATGKPVILLMASGSAIDMSYPDEQFDGILQVWYPGAMGGRAAAELLFGKASPSGKLPVTFYRTLDGMPEFTDYTMKNRTYRYYEGVPLYPFGYGLTYGDLVCTALTEQGRQEDGSIVLKAVVRNEGDRRTEDVLQIYADKCDSLHRTLHPELCGFRRVDLKPGEEQQIEITVPVTSLRITDQQGQRYLDGTRFTFYGGMNQPDPRSLALTGRACSQIEITLDK